VTRRALAVAAILLAGCGAPTPPEAPPAAPAPPAPPQATPTAPDPVLSPLDRYKRDIAREILRVNAARTFDGAPPPLLRAVVVLQLTIDGTGAVTGIRTLRTRDDELAAVATKSVRATAPLPAPPRELLRQGRVQVAETWLFRDDGRFQVRSLAEVQARGNE
jgi:protein TonB